MLEFSERMSNPWRCLNVHCKGCLTQKLEQLPKRENLQDISLKHLKHSGIYLLDLLFQLKCYVLKSRVRLDSPWHSLGAHCKDFGEGHKWHLWWRC